MKEINIVKLKDMVEDFLKENDIDFPIDKFSINGNSLGFKFEYENIEIAVEKKIKDTTLSFSNKDRDYYYYNFILNRKKEKVFE